MSFGRGARVTLLGQWIRFVIQFGGFVLLARLLEPSDFGLVAMAGVASGFAILFADLGLSLAAIQAKELSQLQKSSLLVCNVIAGLAGSVVIAASGYGLASFYDEPRVFALSVVLSLPLLVSATGVQFRVELTRERRFGTLARQDILSAAVGLVAGVICAVLGYGYWALAAQAVVQPLVVTGLAILESKWRPSLQFNWDSIGSLLRFGGSNLALQAVNLASRTVDVAMLGRSVDAAAVGAYSRSSQLISMVFAQVVSPLTRVILPRLAAARDDEDFRGTVERLQCAVSYVLGGILLFIVAEGEVALTVVLGDQWASAGVVLSMLAFGGFFAALGYVYYWALLAKARTSLLLAAELPGRVVMIAGAVIFAEHGPLGVAGAIVAGQGLTYVVGSLVLRQVGLAWVPLVRISSRPLAIFVCAAALSAVVQNYFRSEVAMFIAAVGMWTCAALAAFCLSQGVRRDWACLIDMARAS
ncbi:lipopolysaccharide biosynthesis protein [Nocardioides marmotae]|uniref:lipopolysaccharide biosynthesis protein n=1 Tax=Nocardioides marmotae TaxID=2663857 RepID=UPI0012B5748B|nr:lipopolysaccharide biosynthesis protein [Nocardioides marmotae]MBC9735313.1 lipopolysaccharide biosynthesis protein [Nocardioides marmotae]MTB86413.1 oligosaccharide flippase family protein [Nocardioides marmotae]